MKILFWISILWVFYAYIGYLALLMILGGNWAMVMDIINPKISSSEHEIICSIVNFGSIIIGSATGTLFVLLGANNLFILAGVITLIAIALLYTIKGVETIQWPT